MIAKTLIASTAAAALLLAALRRYRRQPSAARRLILLGASCFVIVAIAHLFEAVGFLPAAGWGQPHSLGHYIDLSAALLGLTFCAVAICLPAVRRIHP